MSANGVERAARAAPSGTAVPLTARVSTQNAESCAASKVAFISLSSRLERVMWCFGVPVWVSSTSRCSFGYTNARHPFTFTFQRFGACLFSLLILHTRHIGIPTHGSRYSVADFDF